MNIEEYFEQEKGITVDAARNAGARYTAIDICKFAKNYNKSEAKSIIEYIESDAEILMPVNELMNEDGTHLTKKEYGLVLLKYLVIELKEKFINN